MVGLRCPAAPNTLFLMRSLRKQHTYSVAAAFAQDRDASYAVRLMSTTSTELRFTLRRVIGENGDVQMYVLEASFPDPALTSRVETAMEGAHGMLIPVEALAAAKAS
jgi:hypothetical protein